MTTSKWSINISSSDNPGSKKLSTQIIIPVSSSPELVLIGYDDRVDIWSIIWFVSSAVKPEQIGADLPDYYSVRSKNSDLEITHTYTLYNKGPSDATRTEIKLLWPMLPLSAFHESTPLLYGIDLPSIIRVSDPKTTGDRCYIYQPVSEYFILQIICKLPVYLD